MNTDLQRVKDAYLQACKMELDAIKPGNVSTFADGHGMTAADFLSSAGASVDPLTDFSKGLGQRIYHAVEQTRAAVGCNTNLGVILLAAPLLEASFSGDHPTLRENLQQVLDATTVQDADWCFRAICLAAPAGLGSSNRHDVGDKASVTLLEAMREAAARDQIAEQYANGYREVFEFALPLMVQSGYSEVSTMTEDIFLAILAHQPDTHIRRKFGEHTAEEVRRNAEHLHERFKRCTSSSQRAVLLGNADHRLKKRGINPGTSADLTVATLLSWQLVRQQTFSGAVGVGEVLQTAQSAYFYQP